MTNHFFLPADEVAAGEWEVRWSEDLSKVDKLEGGGRDDTGGVSP